MVDKLLQSMDLTYMRSEAKTAMPDTVNIQRRTNTSDKQGGYTEAWADAYQNIPARLTIKSGSETLSDGRVNSQTEATLTVPYDQTIEQSNRVVHSSGTYEVQFVNAGKTWAVVTQCQIRRL